MALILLYSIALTSLYSTVPKFQALDNNIFNFQAAICFLSECGQLIFAFAFHNFNSIANLY